MNKIELVLAIIISAIGIITSITAYIRYQQRKGEYRAKDLADHEKIWNEVSRIQGECKETRTAQEITQEKLTALDHEIKSTKYEFKIIEAKLEGISSLILNLQNQFSLKAEKDNDVTQSLIDTIKEMGKDQRKNV